MRVVVLSVVTVLVVVTVVLGTHTARYVGSTLRKTTCDSELLSRLSAVTSHEFLTLKSHTDTRLYSKSLRTKLCSLFGTARADVIYVLFSNFSYMLQKPQVNHNGMKKLNISSA